MSDIIAFETQTPRMALPLLYPGQAQKEVFVNEALVRIDALLHARIEAIASAPLSAPADGQCWIVGENPVGEWVGKFGQIACRAAGNWIFLVPRDGMSVTIGAGGQVLRYLSGTWTIPAPVPTPQGGTTIDSQARAAVTALIARLVTAGIIPVT
ncbi:MAG: DUF2793 domain-containing protein [Novosphingobium sp.]